MIDCVTTFEGYIQFPNDIFKSKGYRFYQVNNDRKTH